MEKKSICKSCFAGKSVPNKYNPSETLYYWTVEFENGDKGSRGTKVNEAPYVVGKEAEYDITEGTFPDGQKRFTIKAVDKKNANGFKRQDPTIKLRAFAVACANRFVISDIVPRPKTEELIDNESNEDWNKFLEVISKYSKSFYKEMHHDCTVYGFQYADVIGTSLSNAIEARISKKIRRDMIFPYYRNLLDSVLVKQEQPQVNQ